MSGGRLARLAVVAAALLFVPACPASPPAAPGDGATVLARVIAAERSVPFSGYKRTIHGVEGEGRATMQTVFAENAEPAFGVAENDQVLAQHARADGRAVGFCHFFG